jgi:cytochrome c oxidase assembly protein subunit 15
MVDMFDRETLRRHRIIATWLLIVAGMVFAMVILGGVTRLTHSGLSMVQWRPITGWLPPLSEIEWQAVFQAYRDSPEYQKVNVGMTLAGFKGIFWLEYLHRLWGRLIGAAFLLPFLVFLAKGWVDRRLGVKLLAMLVLGGLQGVLGWFMVKSGLIDRPDVSQYRLTAHLAAALIIYGYIVWVAFGLLSPVPEPLTPRRPWRAAAGLCALIFVTVLSGGFVAGLDAGFAYNTFPLMDGELIPEHLFDLSPVYLNFFEDVTTVQFTHRVLAVSTLTLVLLFWWRMRTADLAPRGRLAVNVLAIVAVGQVTLGITTLVMFVPVAFAALHQAVAVILLTVALWTAFELRPSGRDRVTSP